RRGRVLPFVEIEITDAHLFFGLERIERVLFRLFCLVFFGWRLFLLRRRRLLGGLLGGLLGWLLGRFLLTGRRAHEGYQTHYSRVPPACHIHDYIGPGRGITWNHTECRATV